MPREKLAPSLTASSVIGRGVYGPPSPSRSLEQRPQERQGVLYRLEAVPLPVRCRGRQRDRTVELLAALERCHFLPEPFPIPLSDPVPAAAFQEIDDRGQFAAVEPDGVAL